jgi:hypothetical protein
MTCTCSVCPNAQPYNDKHTICQLAVGKPLMPQGWGCYLGDDGERVFYKPKP